METALGFTDENYIIDPELRSVMEHLLHAAIHSVPDRGHTSTALTVVVDRSNFAFISSDPSARRRIRNELSTIDGCTAQTLRTGRTTRCRTEEQDSDPVEHISVPLEGDDGRLLGALTLWSEGPSPLDGSDLDAAAGAILGFVERTLDLVAWIDQITTAEAELRTDADHVPVAQGILIERLGTDPDGALAELQRRADRWGVRVSDAALMVIETNIAGFDSVSA